MTVNAIGQYIPILLLGVAFVVLLCALFLPEKKDSDRFFGLMVGRKEQEHRNVSRILAAARALGSESRMSSSEDSTARTTESFDADVLTIEPIANATKTDAGEEHAFEEHAVGDEEQPAELLIAVELRADDVAAEAEPTPADVSSEAAIVGPEIVKATEALEVAQETPIVEAPQREPVADTAPPVADPPMESPNTQPPAAVEAELELPEVENESPGERILHIDGLLWPRLLGLDARALEVQERVGIVRTLGVIGDASHAPVLCEVLEQEVEPQIRDAAIAAIRDARFVAAAPAIEDVLTRSTVDRERLAAVDVAESLDLEDLLVDACNDVCVAVATAATVALGRLRQRLGSAEMGEDHATEGEGDDDGQNDVGHLQYVAGGSR